MLCPGEINQFLSNKQQAYQPLILEKNLKFKKKMKVKFMIFHLNFNTFCTHVLTHIQVKKK